MGGRGREGGCVGVEESLPVAFKQRIVERKFSFNVFLALIPKPDTLILC